jgi:hypothetical protein
MAARRVGETDTDTFENMNRDRRVTPTDTYLLLSGKESVPDIPEASVSRERRGNAHWTG